MVWQAEHGRVDALTESPVSLMLDATRSCVAEWELLTFPLAVAETHQFRFRTGFVLAAHAMNHA